MGDAKRFCSDRRRAALVLALLARDGERLCLALVLDDVLK